VELIKEFLGITLPILFIFILLKEANREKRYGQSDTPLNARQDYWRASI
jgi:hypothetical protein